MNFDILIFSTSFLDGLLQMRGDTSMIHSDYVSDTGSRPWEEGLPS